MSASSKKKLRNEQEAAKLTQRQLAENKEAKKLKIYTITFVTIMVLMLAVALTFGITKLVSNNGVMQRNTVAVTANGHEINAAELNYYYIDAVQNFNSQYGSYASLFGLDVTKPLNEQPFNDSEDMTWADNFLNQALEAIKKTYAVADEAKAQGYTLSENDKATVESTISNLELYSQLYGYPDADTYLKDIYGKGATMESYREYFELNLLAQSYYNDYSANLEYNNDVLREAEKNNFHAYSAFSYNSYYVGANKFLEGGTTDESGNTTYSDAEKAASVTAAKEAADSLIVEEITNVEELDAAIAALAINAEAETAAKSTAYEDVSYTSLNAHISKWIADSSRKAGDKAVLANTSTNDDGTETVNGYYVVMFNGVNDNTFALANVRHILVKFEGGTQDENGTTTYSADEKAAAKLAAQEILDQWKAGEATEESFAALANEKSDDGDGTTGGLYEDVYPGQMVANFEDWCFDAARKAGDTGLIETEYGYHVMFYVGDSDINYRDYLITEELRSTETTAWYDALLAAVTVTTVETKYVPVDMIVNSGNG